MITIHNFSLAPVLMTWGTNLVTVPLGSWSYSGSVTDISSGTTISSGTVIYNSAGVVFEPRMTPYELFGVGTGLGVALMSVAFLTAIARKVVQHGPNFSD